MPQYGPIISTDADESIAVDATARTLTLPAEYATNGGRTGGRATIQVRTAAILYTINGTAPTATDESTGVKLNVGDLLILTNTQEMRNLKMIEATATDAAVFVQYEKKIN
jgi:hypothetical protein